MCEHGEAGDVHSCHPVMSCLHTVLAMPHEYSSLEFSMIVDVRKWGVSDRAKVLSVSPKRSYFFLGSESLNTKQDNAPVRQEPRTSFATHADSFVKQLGSA